VSATTKPARSDARLLLAPAEWPEEKEKQFDAYEHASPSPEELLAFAVALNGSKPFPADFDKRDELLRHALDLWWQARQVAAHTKREGMHVARLTEAERSAPKRTISYKSAILRVTGQRLLNDGQPLFRSWLAENIGIRPESCNLPDLKSRVTEDQVEAWRQSYAAWRPLDKSRKARKAAKTKKTV
jgi:hypothetical protein